MALLHLQMRESEKKMTDFLTERLFLLVAG